jgi:hypothetical protein
MTNRQRPRRLDIVPGLLRTATTPGFLALRAMATARRRTDRFPFDAFNDDLLDDTERARLRSCPANWRVFRGGRRWKRWPLAPGRAPRPAQQDCACETVYRADHVAARLKRELDADIKLNGTTDQLAFVYTRGCGSLRVARG